MIYVLVTLSVLLAISFSVVSVNESQTRSAISTDESTVAFFLAESGAEIFLDRIYSEAYSSGPLSGVYSNCSNGIFTNTLSSGTWTASFFDNNGDLLSSCSSTTWRTDVNEMKIDGNHSNTIRSIRMGIVPPPPPDTGGIPATYVRSNDDNDSDVSLDIGSADSDRLVVIFGYTERESDNDLGNVTVDGKSCNFVQEAENAPLLFGDGNRTELWYCDESDLGSSSGTVTVQLTGGGTSSRWATHALLFTDASQDGPADSGIDDSSTGGVTTVDGIDASENSLVVMGGTHGGTASVDSWTSPLEQKTSAQPTSARAYSATGIETTAQINKSYEIDWSSSSRSSAVAASWDPLE